MEDVLKFRIVVYDLLDTAEAWLDRYANPDHMELCEVITNKPDDPIKIEDLSHYDGWDYLLVFELNMKHLIEKLLRKTGIPDERVIYICEEDDSLCQHADVVNYLFKKELSDRINYELTEYAGGRYAMVSTARFSYVNQASDKMILPQMIKDLSNWSQYEMELLLEQTGHFFEFDDKQDIFCDIGANIGTTCIYFKKYLDPNVTILAFEPSPENYKMLRVNMLLNDFDPDEHILVRVGVSDKSGEVNLTFNPDNPGGSRIDDSSEGESIKVVAFDDYLEQNGIDAARIKYMWVDVEGFEARFLAGAEKTLDIINAPVYMEFVPKFYYGREGEFELLINEIKKHFTRFLLITDIDAGPQPVDRLYEEQHRDTTAWDILLLR